jgi:hypothetical protein
MFNRLPSVRSADGRRLGKQAAKPAAGLAEAGARNLILFKPW